MSDNGRDDLRDNSRENSPDNSLDPPSYWADQSPPPYSFLPNAPAADTVRSYPAIRDLGDSLLTSPAMLGIAHTIRTSPGPHNIVMALSHIETIVYILPSVVRTPSSPTIYRDTPGLLPVSRFRRGEDRAHVAYSTMTTAEPSSTLTLSAVDTSPAFPALFERTASARVGGITGPGPLYGPHLPPAAQQAHAEAAASATAIFQQPAVPFGDDYLVVIISSSLSPLPPAPRLSPSPPCEPTTLNTPGRRVRDAEDEGDNPGVLDGRNVRQRQGPDLPDPPTQGNTQPEPGETDEPRPPIGVVDPPDDAPVGQFLENPRQVRESDADPMVESSSESPTRVREPSSGPGSGSGGLQRELPGGRENPGGRSTASSAEGEEEGGQPAIGGNGTAEVGTAGEAATPVPDLEPSCAVPTSHVPHATRPTDSHMRPSRSTPRRIQAERSRTPSIEATLRENRRRFLDSLHREGTAPAMIPPRASPLANALQAATTPTPPSAIRTPRVSDAVSVRRRASTGMLRTTPVRLTPRRTLEASMPLTALPPRTPPPIVAPLPARSNIPTVEATSDASSSGETSRSVVGAEEELQRSVERASRGSSIELFDIDVRLPR